MKHAALIFGLVLAVCATATAGWIPEDIPAEFFEKANAVDSVIVVFKDEANLADKKSGKSRIEQAQFKNVQSIKAMDKGLRKKVKAKRAVGKPVSKSEQNLSNMYKAQLAPGRSVSAALRELSSSPLVAYAEPDWPLELFSAPNDEHFDPEQWSLNNTGQAYHTAGGTTASGSDDADIDWLEAWESPDFPTNEIIIAVIDTGVDYTHPDITNQMWRNMGETGLDTNGFDKASNGVDDDLNGYIDDYLGIDLVNTDSDPMDDHLHGTHVAGTIGAQTDNGYGIVGVCPAAKIMAIKIFNAEGSGNTSDGVPAIRYAADNGAKVINNSWGGGGYSQALQDAITYANEAGVSVMCAAGNNGSYMAMYPASYRGSVSVGATDSTDGRASFSNYGPWVDVMAPGHDILSLLTHLVPNPPYGKFDENFLIISGTSMATPTAAGAMGLLMSKYPGHEPWIYEKVMEASCDASLYDLPANSSMQSGWLGAGRIDVDDLLRYDETNAFLRSYIDLHMGFGRSFLAPGEATHLVVKIGTWTHDIEDLELVVTSLSSNATLNATNFYIGSLPALTTVALPENTFVVGCTTNAQWNSVVRFRIDLKSGDTVLESRTNGFSVYSGQVSDFCTYDLDGDGTKEVIGKYGSVLSVFDLTGRLKWFHDVGQGWSIFGSPAVGDIDHDGKGEIAITAEKLNVFFTTEASLTVFEDDGSINTNVWPIDLQGEDFHLADRFFPSAEPAGLLDADGDGDLDIAVNASYYGRGRYGVFDEYGTELGYEQSVTSNRTTSWMALGDINDDGTDEIVSIEDGDLGDTHAAWLTVRDSLAASQYEIRIGGSTNNVDYGGSLYAPVMADVDFDSEKEFVVICSIDGVGMLTVIKQDGTTLDGFPVQVNNTKDYEIPEVADIDGDGDLEIFSFRSDLGQILGFDHHGRPLPGYPLTDTNLPPPETYSSGYRFVIGDVDGDRKPELVYGGNYHRNDDEEHSYSFQIIARDIEDGLMVPGYPITLEGTDGGSYAKYRVVLDDLTRDEFGTNQYLVATIGSELFVIGTGKPFDPNQQHWSHMNHDTRNSFHYDIFPGELLGGFSSETRFGVNHYTASFKGFHYATNTTDVTWSWDFDGDGTNELSGTGLDTPTHDYTAPGLYTVSLTLSNAAGEVYSVTHENFITVYSDLTTDFVYSPTSALVAPIRIDFTDLSQNGPQAWFWNFGDGHTSTEQHPKHLYATNGTFTVTLSVSNNFGVGGSSTGQVMKTDLIHISGLQSNATTHHLAPSGLSIYPYKTWAEAATNLADVVLALEPGHTVLVTNGTYTIDAYTQVNINEVTIRSVNGPHATFFDGRRASPGILLRGTNSVIEGFTLRNCVGQPPTLSLNDGAHGRNLIVHNNARMGVFNGIIYVNRATLTDTYAYSNKCSSGAGLFAAHSTVSNCVFKYNESFDGSIVGLSGLDGSMYNSLISDNICGISAVKLNTGGNLYNCTIANNTILSIHGGGLMFDGFSYDDASTAHNVISYDNSNGRNVFFDWPSSDPQNEKPLYRALIRNCCWPVSVADQQETGQIQNEILADPQFINATAGNYRLQSTSPCRDAGLDTVAYTNAVQNILVDFGTAGFTSSSGSWNNITTTQAELKFADMVNTNGGASGLSLELLTDFDGIAADGYNPDPDFSYPADASRDYAYVSTNADHLNLLQVGGIDTNHIYDYTFYASRTGETVNATAYFTIGLNDSGLLSTSGDRQVEITGQQFDTPQMVVQISCWGGDYSPLGILQLTERDPASAVNVQAGYRDLGGDPRVTGDHIDVGAYEWTASNLPSVTVQADVTEGSAPLNVSFSTTAWDDGWVEMYHWDFGDGTTLSGPSLTDPDHTYNSGRFVATVTVTDNDGMSSSGSIGIVVDPQWPAAPSALSALNINPSRNDLSWSDQASNETSFVLQRRIVTNAAEIIIDNTDPNVNYVDADHYPWLTQTHAEDYGSNYRICKGHNPDDGPAPSEATYRPVLPEDGWYEIYEWHPGHANHSPVVRTEIHHKTGREFIYINQKSNGGQWNLLGTWELERGSYVNINPFANNEWVVADAIKFVRVEPYQPLATLAPNAESYSHTDLTADRTYGYRIAASNAHGQSAWISAKVEIPSTNARPVATIVSLSTTSGIPDLAVDALGSGTDSDGTITNYLWNFGDGYSGSIQSGPNADNVRYVYRNIGIYDITLTVFDNLGDSDTVTNTVNVYGAVPNPPSELQARNIGDLYLEVTWADNAYNEERVTLQRQADGGAFSTLVILGEAADRFADSDVVFDTTYGYRARTENVHGTSDWSNVGSAHFGEPTNYELPFSEPFESTNITTGTLHGQHGWTGGGTVQTSEVHNGSQALSLAQETASHTFLGEATNVWITLWSHPVFSEEAPENIPADSAAVFYINTNRQLVAYNSTNATTIESPIFSNGWNKIELSCDFISKVWNLSLNDVPMVGNFAFYGSPASFGLFQITEGSRDYTAYVDDINITDSQNDFDGDGLPDSWENQYWPGDLSHSPGDLSSNGVDTVYSAYIAGFDPTDPNARFALSNLSNILWWNAASGRVYTVYWTSNLLDSFQTLETNYTGGAFTDSTHGAEAKGFYKIEVQIEE